MIFFFFKKKKTWVEPNPRGSSRHPWWVSTRDPPIGEATKIDGPSFPFEMLSSLVITDDMNDELDDMLKFSFVKSSLVVFGFEAKKLGSEKTRVKLYG
jgi:hypothetical protein